MHEMPNPSLILDFDPAKNTREEEWSGLERRHTMDGA